MSLASRALPFISLLSASCCSNFARCGALSSARMSAFLAWKMRCSSACSLSLVTSCCASAALSLARLARRALRSSALRSDCPKLRCRPAQPDAGGQPGPYQPGAEERTWPRHGPSRSAASSASATVGLVIVVLPCGLSVRKPNPTRITMASADRAAAALKPAFATLRRPSESSPAQSLPAWSLARHRRV